MCQSADEAREWAQKMLSEVAQRDLLERLDREVRELRQELEHLRQGHKDEEIARLRQALRNARHAAERNDISNYTCCMQVMAICDAVL